MTNSTLPLLTEVPPVRLSLRQMLVRIFDHPAVLFILVLVCAFTAVSILQANAHDNRIHRRASYNVFMLHRFPWDDAIEQQKTLYFHPLHTAIITAPFNMLGEQGAGFWNTAFILMVLIGFRRGGASLATLLFAISPPVAFVIASANMPGYTSGLGLIFILAERVGPLRAYGWALMLCRPQDSVFVLIWSAQRALRQRDWVAFVLAGLIVLPSLLTLQHWLQIIPQNSDQLQRNIGNYYSMSIAVNNGLPLALAVIVLIFAYRLHHFHWLNGRLEMRRRKLGALTLTEWVWLLTSAWFMVSPYYLIYMLWMLLLPLRLCDIKRTLLAWVSVLVIGVFYMQTPDTAKLYIGGLWVLLLMTLLTPKLDAADAPVGEIALDLSNAPDRLRPAEKGIVVPV